MQDGIEFMGRLGIAQNQRKPEAAGSEVKNQGNFLSPGQRNF